MKGSHSAGTLSPSIDDAEAGLINIQGAPPWSRQFSWQPRTGSRKSLWRLWKQLSRFQRYLVCVALVLISLFLFMYHPWYVSAAESASLHLENSKLPHWPEHRSESPNEKPPSPLRPSGEERKEVIEDNLKIPSLKHSLNADELKSQNRERREAIVAAFKHAWKGYKQYAWGHDHLRPISKTYHDWFGVGLTIIDSLDTMYMMGLTEEFEEAKSWIREKLNFDINKDVNLFETSIRVLGGLLSAYSLSHDSIFLEKATDIGTRLLPGFRSRTGVPYSDVNLGTGIAHAPSWAQDSTVSEVSSIQLEFRTLSRITRNTEYETKSFFVSEHIHSLPKKEGLVPMFINADTGRLNADTTLTLGARADSYYEYLLKQWIQTGKTVNWLKEDYLQAVDGIRKNLVRTSLPNKLVFIGELLHGRVFTPKMDHLVCYFPGTLALGHFNGLPKEHLSLAVDLMETCFKMYAVNPTFLSPEIVHFNLQPTGDRDILIKSNDAHNLLRPETLESLWYLYYFTQNQTYQDWAWMIFQGFEKYTKVSNGGYTSINNVMNKLHPKPRDMMESFFLAETLKYLYLIFTDDQEKYSPRKYVYNTEAHPLPMFDS